MSETKTSLAGTRGTSKQRVDRSTSLASRVAWLVHVIALGPCAAVLAQDAQEPAPLPPSDAALDVAPQAPDAAAVQGSSTPAFAPRYRLLIDVAEWLGQASASSGGLATTLTLGAADSVRAPALQIARPGPVAPEDRPTIFLLGGLDGVSLAGGEAVLAVVADLLAKPESVPVECTVIAVPWASPEALTLALANDVSDGRNARPLDDDRDGAVDEDGPDDLDGDGLALSMLVADPKGAWARASDPRFVVPAGPNDGVRYHLCREGRDDDRDGRFNEDPQGGVTLDLNFPVGRDGGRAAPSARTSTIQGSLPLSEPIARELADLALARRTVAVLVFQGNHGAVASPGGVAATGELVLDGDRAIFERAAEAFAGATGRRVASFLPLHKARGAERAGAAIDWFHAVPRALALEVAMWGPCVETSDGVAAKDARFDPDASSPPTGGARASTNEFDRAWARWLDNSHGGLGFVDWHPVELEGGEQALVGGFEPRTIDNPPAELLPRALAGAGEFVRQMLQGLPKLEVRVLESSRDGDVCRVRARVRNQGSMPTGLLERRSARDEQGVHVRLELPSGAELLAGAATVGRPRLFGGEQSEDFEWLVLAPAGSTLVVRASAEWTTPVTREVRP